MVPHGTVGVLAGHCYSCKPLGRKYMGTMSHSLELFAPAVHTGEHACMSSNRTALHAGTADVQQSGISAVCAPMAYDASVGYASMTVKMTVNHRQCK